MALSTRELYLILRARDEASRVLRNVAGSVRGLDKDVAAAAQRNMQHGQALATIGVAVAASGVIGLQALNNMVNAATDYNQEAAKTLTQTDKLGASMDQLKNIGRDVARTIPVPFEQVQATMYDIFSSMDVNVRGAAKLTKQFAKDAVGGSVDIQDAGRATISILNAYKVPVKDVTKISDVMFQLVRKGVGTYREFSSTIGRAVPSAVRAGQSIYDLTGALAFMTRNGVSTAMAATSVARAMDALSNPKAVKNLHQMGVEVVDAHGKFRPLVDVIEDMRKKTENMSKPEKSKWLHKAFLGAGGTIQAMRVFNLGLDDSSGLLRNMTNAMKNSGGAAKDAYNIMSNTPAAKIQLLKNRFEVLKTEIGDQLIPIKQKLVEWILKLMDAWDRLSPRTKTLLVRIVLLASALAVIVGTVTAVAGVFLMLQGAMAIAGVALGEFLLPIGIVVGAIVLLGVGIYELVKHWDAIKPAIMNAAASFMSFVSGPATAIKTAFIAVWNTIKTVGTWLWATFGPTLVLVWAQLKNTFVTAWATIKTAMLEAWSILKPAFADIQVTFGQLMVVLRQLWAVWGTQMTALWNLIKPLLGLIVGVVILGIISGFQQLAATITFIVTVISKTIGPLANFIAIVVGAVWDVIKNFIGLVASIMRGDWKNVWEYAKRLVASIFLAIAKIIGGAILTVLRLIGALISGVIAYFRSLYNTLVGHSIIPDLVNGILRWFRQLPGALLKIAADIWRGIVSKFKEGAANALQRCKQLISDIKAKFTAAKNLLVNAGGNIIDGLLSGIKKGMSGIGGWVKNNVVDPIVSAVKKFFGIHSPSTVMAGLGGHLAKGLVNGLGSLGGGATIVKRIFGSFPKALGAMLNKGLINFGSLGTKAMNALPSSFFGNLGGAGGKKMSGGIVAIARRLGASYVAGHRDPQGGPAYDLGSSGARNNAIANALRANHARLGLRYVISQMRIASARSGWNWRRYTPITNQGDFRHVGHVHVSYRKGGVINEPVFGWGQKSGKSYQFGENGAELVVPEGSKMHFPAPDNRGAAQPTQVIDQKITINTQEINPLKHAADLGWLLASRTS
jgi:TP901 family phage tail tape measure protein